MSTISIVFALIILLFGFDSPGQKRGPKTTAAYADMANRKVPLHPSVSSALSAVFRFFDIF
jgi:hypothetical protein